MIILNAGSVATLAVRIYDVEASPRAPINPDTTAISIYGPTGTVIVSAAPMIYGGSVGKFLYNYQSAFSDANGTYKATVVSTYGIYTYPTAPKPVFRIINGANAQGTNTLPPDSTSGITYGHTVYTVNSVNGVDTLTIAGGIQATRKIKQITYRITTAFGVSLGLTTLAIYAIPNTGIWATGIVPSLGVITLPGDIKRTDEPYAETAYDILIKAEAGLFDATGQIKVTVHWETFTPST